MNFTTVVNTFLIYICCNQISQSSGQMPSIASKIDEGINQLLRSCEGKLTISNEKLQTYRNCAQTKISNMLSESRQNSAADFKTIVRLQCRFVSDLLSCLKPLTKEIEICSSKGEKEMLGMVTKVCENEGAGILNFENGILCVANNIDAFTNCFASKDVGKYLKNPELMEQNPCPVISVFETCTLDTLDSCPPNKNDRESFKALMENANKQYSVLADCSEKSRKEAQKSRNHGHSVYQKTLLPFVICAGFVNIF